MIYNELILQNASKCLVLENFVRDYGNLGTQILAHFIQVAFFRLVSRKHS